VHAGCKEQVAYKECPGWDEVRFEEVTALVVPEVRSNEIPCEEQEAP
jgi:hypothetical protein